jgi:hypothetical protein
MRTRVNFSASATALLIFLVSLQFFSADQAKAAYTTGSAQFGSSGQYLSVAGSSDLAPGTGDFTIEWWQYMTAAPGDTAVSNWPRVWWMSSSFGVSIENSPDPTFYLWLGGANAVGTMTDFANSYKNRWMHVAITRSGTSVKVFINGTQFGNTVTNSTNLSDSSSILAIGNHHGDSGRCAFPGRITNFHFVKGSALYTSNFTAPTTPTSAISNSKLLLRVTNVGNLLTNSATASLSLTNVGSVTFSSESPSWVDPDTTPPVITGPGSATGTTSSISIPETATSVFTFAANESVSWSKSGADQARFTLTGAVLTISLRDFETPQSTLNSNVYVVAISATDASTNTTTQTLSVTITNVNEAPVIGAFSGAVSATYSVSENTTGLFNINATDVDAGTTLTYTLTGTDANDFTISSSGALAFSPAADFEAPTDDGANNTYVVVTWASDGALTDSQTVTITVTNSNESGALGTPTLSATPYKGISVNLSVTINAAGKVRFLVGNKRIPNCLAVAASGSGSTFTATCSWKPASTGMQNLSASFTPSSGTFSSATSPTLSVRVFKRTTTR